jgi:hypothetical protein
MKKKKGFVKRVDGAQYIYSFNCLRSITWNPKMGYTLAFCQFNHENPEIARISGMRILFVGCYGS